ncbi:MAG TPA: response regulator [Methanoregula sp.]|nr:response regulator [Methanoregula sp.]
MTGESILVVEDEAIIALQLSELLKKNGYQVAGMTANGEDAVMMAEKNSPDLIFMDIELMGKMDGIEAACTIHERANIPIIYLTAFSDIQRIARAKETMPYNYIVKPFNEQELLASVDMALYRHTVEQRLRESMQRYRTIVDNAAEGIMIISCETRTILETNPASIRLLGYTAGELTGMTVDNLIAAPDGKAWGERACSIGGWSGEVQFRHRDGSLRDVELTSSIIHQKGSPTLSCFVAHDVTDRKRAEVALRQALRKLNILSSITRHDILNQLITLRGFLSILEQKQPNPTLREYFQKINAAAQRISAMIRFTKEYEEIGVHAPSWLDTRTIISTAVKETSLGKVKLNYNLPSGAEVYADPLIVKVFYNLMDNALRYGQKITTIQFSMQESGDGHLIVCDDDGVGIPAEEKEKIFDRGFGKNTGLGLALSREILSITGITIRETGMFGSGARFEMLVPAGSFRYHKPG